MNPSKIIGESVGLIAKIVGLFAPKDRPARARSHRARADHLEKRAEGIGEELRVLDLSLGMSKSGRQVRYLLRVTRRLRLKRTRILDRAMWWNSRADLLDPPKENENERARQISKG
jgi:hypothetical protein